MFELDGDRVDAPAGTFVFARPGVKRTAFAEEPGTTILALGGTPGKAYEPDGWELWAPLSPLYEEGEYAEVADRLRVSWSRLIRSTPSCSTTSPAARASPAGRLTRSTTFGVRSRCRSAFRAYATGDSDFDPIRDEPAFKELIGQRQSIQMR